MKKNILSLLVALVMIISMMPGYVLAKTVPELSDYGDFIDGDHVINDLINVSGMNAHPRIIMTEEKLASLRSHIDRDTVTGVLLSNLRAEADRIIRECPICEYDAYGTAHLLETSKRVQRYVATLAMAYNLFGEDRYAERAYQELESACNYPDWSPKHFLDTAEMCTAFAYGYDWLYHWMTPEQRELIRTTIVNNGLTQVMEDYKDEPIDRTRTYKWYQDKDEGDNWQLVCTGGTNLAALAIGDEEDAREIASQVLTYGYKRAYSFVRLAYSIKDGTYIEGLGYWDYATYYLGLQSCALKSATGTDYGLADYEGVRKSVEFVRYMSSNAPTSFSFGDDDDSRETDWAVFLWLGKQFNAPEISGIRLKKLRERPSYSYFDVLWIDESNQSSQGGNYSTDYGSVGASNASFRNTWKKSGTIAALHAGENNYKYHGHYDLGSFYIESNGSRFFTDLGNENYKLDDRLYSYRIKAEGHNTLVINPTEDIDQREGADCLITEFQGGNEAYAVTDLTDAYAPSGAKKVTRALKMIKDKECIIIQDEISLNQPGEIYWFAHTKGQIDIAADGRSAIVTVGSDRLWVELISEDGQFTAMKAEPLPTSKVVPGAKDNSEYRKLAVHLTNTKDTTISVVCIPLKKGETRPLWIPSLKAISEWSSQTHLDENLCGCSLSLSGDIGVNFYMDLSSSVLTDDAYMEFAVPSGDKIQNRKVYVKAKAGESRAVADVVTKDGKTYYVFKCQVSAKDFASTIGMQMVDNGTYGKKYTYSVKDYADYLLTHEDENAEYKQAAPFVNTLVCYSTWAQQYFGIDPALIDTECLNYDEVSSVTAQEVKSAAPASKVALNQIPGVTFEGSSIALKSETTLSLYFSSSEKLTFSSDHGNKLETYNKDGYQVVRICGISASDFDELFELKISCGGNEGMIRYSVLNFMSNALRYYTDDTLLNLVKSLYLHYKAAEIYI